MQKTYIAIILLVVVIGVGLDFIVYQKKIISGQGIKFQELSEEVDKIKAENNALEKKSSADSDKISELNLRIDAFELKVKDYLSAEGRKCDKDIDACLDELSAKLKPTELRCDPISDGVCPPFCGLSLDYDCCIVKGYKWIQGQGCYS